MMPEGNELLRDFIKPSSPDSECRIFVRNARIIPAGLANDNENYCGAAISGRRVSPRCETVLTRSRGAETVIYPVKIELLGIQDVKTCL